MSSYFGVLLFRTDVNRSEPTICGQRGGCPVEGYDGSEQDLEWFQLVFVATQDDRHLVVVARLDGRDPAAQGHDVAILDDRKRRYRAVLENGEKQIARLGVPEVGSERPGIFHRDALLRIGSSRGRRNWRADAVREHQKLFDVVVGRSSPGVSRNRGHPAALVHGPVEEPFRYR